jgi:CelD/BcsL family acetyltransferase involved in cellulose biosynthesis
MHVRIIRNSKGLLELKDKWDRFLNSSGQNMPFYSWAWYSAWWKHFGENNDLFLLVAEESDGCLQGIAPLYRKRTRIRGLPVRELRFLDNSIGPRNAILLQKGPTGIQALKEIVECINEHRVEWDLITLSNIEAESNFLTELVKYLHSAGFRFLQEPARQSPYIALEGSFEDYWTNNFNSKFRNNILRKLRVQNNHGHCQVVSYTEPSDMERALRLTFEISSKSWKGRIGADMGGSAERKAFYREVTHALAEQSQVRIWISIINDSPIALSYQLISEHAVHQLVGDFDDSYRSLAPGNILLYHIIQQTYGERIRNYDFCGNAYEYEKPWAKGVKRHIHFQIFNANYYSSLIYTCKTRILPLLRCITTAFSTSANKIDKKPQN